MTVKARLDCWPVEPNSVRIESDGQVLEDDGDGKLIRQGTGTWDGDVDYSYGFLDLDFKAPVPAPGSEIKANYIPVEGGCPEDCSKCVTHRIFLDISPGAITGQSQISITDAWTRLIVKIKRDVLPIHVELFSEAYAESYRVQVGHRFDITAGDTEDLDSEGLRVAFDDTSW